MNDCRNTDSTADSTSLNTSSRRESGSSQSSSTGRRYQDGSSRNSGHHSTYEDLAKSFKQQLLVANRRLKGQELHAINTKQQISALTNELKLVNDARITAVREAAKASEELKLYKIQLQNAHQEIRRAQEIIDKVDQERYDAEKAAAEARTMARRYQRDFLMIRAMEEGRKLGMQEGIEQGRALALRETGEYEDMNNEVSEGYANEYLDYADTEFRPRSLLLASNEEIVIHPPQPSNIESIQPPVPQPSNIESTQPPQPSNIEFAQPPQPSNIEFAQPPQPPNIEFVPQPPSQPIPVPPPEPVQPIPPIRPRSFRSPSPSVIYPPVSIPPDGYIPTIDPDNVIRIPPPHELTRPPPTPERPVSPQLPEVSQEELRPGSRSHKRRPSSSSFASASTFSNAAGPLGRATPLSAIPEAQSPYTSPVPQVADGHALRHHPSQISSHRSSNVNPERGGVASPQPAQSTSIRRRSSIRSNGSGSLRPSSANQEDRRKSTTSSSAPGIAIVPPVSPRSRPLSSGILQSQHIVSNNPSGGEGITDVSKPPSIMSQLSGNRIIGQTGPLSSGAVVSSPHQTPEALPIAMPGAYRGPMDPTLTRESGHRLIDDDVMSVRSGDTLTTPQMPRHSHHRTSLDSLRTENPHMTGWEDAVRLAGSHIPVPHDIRTSRPVSRNTERSNR